ncbi:Gamma-glutamyltranspeptidase [Dactylellina cionopaga]|nr:Gamma-glutamyltranspeptidase [Dactylellina cionopaga]
MYDGNEDASLWGGLASGVPGLLRGLEYLHKHHASLPWKTLVEPSISIARHGFKVNQDLLDIFPQLEPDPSFLANDPSWAVDFAPKGRLVQVGETLTRRRYADLLQLIADEGPNTFYTGWVARTTIAALQAKNGTMTMDDLKNYKVTIRKPLTIRYRGYKVTSCSAPSGGPVVLSILKTIEGYEDIGNPACLNISTHRIDEATRFGFGAVSVKLDEKE